MLLALATKIFGSSNERVLKGIHRHVDPINALESKYEKLSDSELQAQTGIFRQRLANGEPLDFVLPDAFATVREAAKRTLGQRHFDVQLMGGIILHQGKISEMKTGEGKTLVATLAVYLNALEGKGVHVVTVNDYLARRDSEWMGRIYRFLGLSVGCIATLLQYGSDAIKKRYLPSLISGHWTGTMCLTEPQCGSDLGQIKTRAIPTGDGRYAVNGTKIFIWW